MSARILALPLDRMRKTRRMDGQSTTLASPDTIHFWRGASGRAYVHSVYSLFDCPPLPDAIYVLARRDESGRAAALHVGRLQNAAPTLNLAEVRQRAATIGAKEVHVHLLASDENTAVAVECDLASAVCA